MKTKISLKAWLAISMFLLATECGVGLGAIIYVDADVDANGDGTSWATAYRYLHWALDEASSGDEIWVAQGTYVPRVFFTRENTFELRDGVSVHGGFPSGGGTWADRDPAAYETILSGDLLGDDIPVDNPEDLLTEPTRDDNCYHVVTAIDADETACLDGFTITGGNANGADSTSILGGGIYISFFCSPSLINCTFRHNSASEYGGGMYNSYLASPTLTNCKFQYNSAGGGGGGICIVNESSLSLIGCNFFENYGGRLGGGGIFNGGSNQLDLTGCTFDGNRADGPGGGMFNQEECDLTVIDCEFRNNEAVSNIYMPERSAGGGGIYNGWACLVYLYNTNFYLNRAADGGGMYNEMICFVDLHNTDFGENIATHHGGGMYNGLSSWVEMVDCDFIENYARHGGGLFSESDSETLDNCDFLVNEAKGDGGGIFELCDSMTLTGCDFFKNSASYFGGGIASWGNGPTMTNCIFRHNFAESGGGMCNMRSRNSQLINCTFKENRAHSGGGIYDRDGSKSRLTNCILWGYANDEIVSSLADVYYSDIRGGWPTGAGNIDADPLFEDYYGRLAEGSPCIDAGDSSAVPPDVTTDFDGNPRIRGARVDMGAYESAYWDTDGDGIANSIDTLPHVPSSEFADAASPVSTYGEIVSPPPADREVAIWDLPDPVGVWIEAIGSSTTEVRVCGGETHIIGDVVDAMRVTCTNSSMIEVVCGTVEIVFFAADGRVATTSLDAGNSLLFDPEAFTIVAGEANDDIVVVIVDGEAYPIEPGETKTFVIVDIEPDLLDVNSKGRWITCYIDLPEGYDAGDIKVDSVLLEGLLEVQRSDVQGDVLMVKFGRKDLIAYITIVLGIEPPGYATLVVTGEMTDGTEFGGSATIQVVQDYEVVEE